MRKTLASFCAMLTLLIVLTSSPSATSASSTVPRYKALSYRVVGHGTDYVVVRGHHRKLVVRDHHRYATGRDGRRYRVVRRAYRYVVLRRVASPTPTPAPTGPDHYVATTGNDTTGNGSAGSPWRTIQKAANSVSAGEVVSVGPGTYNERVTIPAGASGTAADTTQFIANGSVVVSQAFVINSNYTVLDGFEVTPGSSSITDNQRTVGQVQIAGNYDTVKNLYIHDLVRGTGITVAYGKVYNTIDSCTISKPKQGGIGSSNDLLGPSYTTVRNCTISKWAGEVGLDTVGDHWTVEGCTLRGVSTSDYQNPATQNGDGIWANHSSHNVIRNCRIYDIWSYRGYASGEHADGIQIWTGCTDLKVDSCTIGSWKPGGADNTPGPTMGFMFGTVSDGSANGVTIQNCLFLDGVAANTHPTATGLTNGTLNLTFTNNTFFGNYPELSHVTSITLRNNVFYSHRGFGGTIDADHNAFMWMPWESGSSSMSSAEGAHSLGKTYATRLVAANIFVNPDVSVTTDYGLNADFSPKPGSVQIGAGDPAYAPTHDITGAARSATAPSIGAYE